MNTDPTTIAEAIAQRDAYREAFNRLANEVEEHARWLRDYQIEPDLSPGAAADHLENMVSDIESQEGITR